MPLHNIKIQSRFTTEFVKEIRPKEEKPGNFRSHSTVNITWVHKQFREDILKWNAIIKVMEQQIQDDVKKSRKQRKLIKSSAYEIKMKFNRYKSGSTTKYVSGVNVRKK